MRTMPRMAALTAALVLATASPHAWADCGLDGVDVPTQAERHLARSVRVVAEARTIPSSDAMDAAEACNEIIRQLANVAVKVGSASFPSLTLDSLASALTDAAGAVMSALCAYAYETGEDAVTDRLNTYTNIATYIRSNPVRGLTGLADGTLATSLSSATRVTVSAPSMSSASSIAARLSQY